ncbi:MAG TPA: AAA family ATPase [Albitalea sp.]|nr:AAA family ATPase [Albitalea sp.]
MPRPLTHTDPIRIRFDQFELDEANALLLRDGKAVAVAPTPFSVLCALARQPGALLTKGALLDAVWGHQFVSESVLKTAVSDLRMALGDTPREPRIIETVPRRGYRFIAAPRAVPQAHVAPETAAPSASAVTIADAEAEAFIGRADAMTRLRRAWQRACGGQRAVVWVAGEPGIGKTTLIEHFAASLGNVVFVRGQCVEHYGNGESYLPVLEALAELCRKDPALPPVLRTVAPTWMLQLPWLSTAEERGELRRELAGVGPDRMLREMGELLDRYTGQRPLLLVTEDLHWADRATVQLIDHVARRRGRAGLMWLATFRLAEVVALDHPLNPLRRELRLHRLCEEIVLDPFSETEVAAFVGLHSPSLARDEAFVRALHARTDGVPLFVSSVVAEVVDRSEQHADASTRLAAVVVPENLVAIIDHQIAKLGAEQRNLLAAAAVCGADFRAETIAHALQQDITSVAVACDELVRQHVWLSAPRSGDESGEVHPAYAFRHALLRQVLYDRTPSPARAQLHRAVGAALERERAAGVAVAASELAMHFDRGRQPMAALRHFAEAADAALLNFSPAASIAMAQRGLALVPQVQADDERDALELALATLLGVAAFQSHGVGPQAKVAFERAYTLLAAAPNHPMRRRLLHGLGYCCSLRGEYVDALVVAKRAEVLSAESDDRELMLVACFLHGEAHHLQGQTQAARSWAERGLAIAETLDNAATEVFAADPQVALLGMLAVDLVRSGLVQRARALVERAHARAHALRQPMTRLVAAWHEALVEVRLGSADRLAALADEMQALVDEFSLAHGHTASRWFRGWAEARKGRPREGFHLIRQACEESLQLGMWAGASEVLGYAAEALLLDSDVEGAKVQLQKALQIADQLDEGVYLPQLLLSQAAIARAQGERKADAAALRRSVNVACEQQAPWLELLARVELCAHDDAGADDWQALASLVDRLPEAASTEAVQQARALLGARA